MSGNFLLIEKKLALLERINDTEGLPLSKLHNGIYLCYGTASSVLKIFERNGLVKTIKIGRKRVAHLTDNGKRDLKKLKIIKKL